MTLPRRILKGRTYLVTRRCALRRLLLTPKKTVNLVVRYALASAAARTGVLVCAFLVSSNHIHGIVEDPNGRLPEFMHHFDMLVARALNAHYGRGESFWKQPGRYSSVELRTQQDVLRKLVYLYTNVVKDGLVRRPEQWPGFLTQPADMGQTTLELEKPPTSFFGGRRGPDYEPTFGPSKKAWRVLPRNRKPPEPKRRRRRRQPSTLPSTLTLALHVPSIFADLELEAFHRMVEAAVEARLREIHLEHRAAGRRYLGKNHIRSQDPFSTPHGDVFPDFSLNPHVAGTGSVRRERLRELVRWRRAYRTAWEEWNEGNREAVFPRGAYAMSLLHNVKMARQ